MAARAESASRVRSTSRPGRPAGPIAPVPADVEADLASFDRWMLRQGLSEVSRRLRVVFGRSFWRRHETWDVPAEEVAAWLAGYSGWTRQTYHNHLSALYGFLVESGAVERSPLAGLRRGKTPRSRPSALTREELDLALAAADDRMRAWLLLGSLAGLRVHEIAKVHGRDVTEQRIRIVGKGGLDATVPTHPALWELAQDYPRDDYWFPSRQHRSAHITSPLITTTVRQLFRSVGIESGSIHRCRHTFATTLLRNGVNIRVVQELMRHSSIETTAKYLLVADDELSSAVAGLGSSL